MQLQTHLRRFLGHVAHSKSLLQKFLGHNQHQFSEFQTLQCLFADPKAEPVANNECDNTK
jgi:hypothetical protein